MNVYSIKICYSYSAEVELEANSKNEALKLIKKNTNYLGQLYNNLYTPKKIKSKVSKRFYVLDEVIF